MDRRQHYLAQAKFAAGMRADMLANVADDEAYWQPAADIPPVVWHVAHIHATNASALLGMGLGDLSAVPAGWGDLFGVGVTLPDSITALPPLSEVTAAAVDLAAAVNDYVATLDDERLDQPLPNPEGKLPDFLKTLADCLMALHIHESHHNGETMLLLRQQGKPRMM